MKLDTGFAPPQPSTPPAIDGMGGSQTLFEWTYERERARYAAAEEVHHGFVAGVKRSIHLALAAEVDVSEGHGFGKLFAELRNRLRTDTLTEKLKFEAAWRVITTGQAANNKHTRALYPAA